jgi:hypothetical protein
VMVHHIISIGTIRTLEPRKSLMDKRESYI